MSGAALDGRVVVCTGGGSGIGRAAVEAFLAAGAAVAVLELDPAKVEDLRGLGDRVLALRGDATSAASTEALVEAAVDRWGRLDVVATFAGIFDHYRRLEDIPREAIGPAFDEIFAVNVRSVLLVVQAALPALRAARGCVVLTLSTSSFYAGRGGPLYVASKFAARGLVMQLAHELAPEIRVNGVAPGGTLDTDLRGARSLGAAGERLGDRPGRREELEARTPLHVALTPAHHAGAYVFLASDASSGITGEVVRSDGGIGVR